MMGWDSICFSFWWVSAGDVHPMYFHYAGKKGSDDV
jgi:arginine/lysine/ornithine decarboxylase